MNPYKVLTFQCVVVEDGERCKSMHTEPIASPKEEAEFVDSKFLCENCMKAGYAWFSQLFKDQTVTVDEVLQDPKGARTKDLTKKSMTPEQIRAAENASKMLHGWGVVQVFEDDALMLRQDEASNKGEAWLQRKLKSTYPGLNLTTKKDPFEGRLD